MYYGLLNPVARILLESKDFLDTFHNTEVHKNCKLYNFHALVWSIQFVPVKCDLKLVFRMWLNICLANKMPEY